MKKNLVILLSILLIIVSCIGIYSFIGLNKDKSGSKQTNTGPQISDSDEEIKQKLRCDRVTAEVLPTDKYCDDLDLYRADLKLTDEQVRQKFECDRLTKERRQTDAYCQDPQRFRDDLESGVIIDDPANR